MHVRKAVDTPGCKSIRVEAHTTKPKQIKLVKLLFGNYTHVHCKNISNKTIRALCFLDESFSFLLPKKDKIENWMLLEKNLFFSFLAGYVDAEGHIGIMKSNGAVRLKIDTYDKGIIFSIQKKLIKFNINCPPIRIAIHKGYASHSYPDRLYNKNLWEVCVYGKNLVLLLDSLLPHLKHEKRKSDALKVLNHVSTNVK